ncbi:MAG: hypothetical protein HAW63_03720 [Bdellovibrionaceae bacterium]|nr:hypothetical protein [Pseudobdellovibrionaceae bacterium]
MNDLKVSSSLPNTNFLKVSEVIGFSNCMVIANQAYIVEAKGYNLMLRIFSQHFNAEWLQEHSLESLVFEDLSLFITDMNMDVEAQVLKVYQSSVKNAHIDIKLQLADSLPEYWTECFADMFSPAA